MARPRSEDKVRALLDAAIAAIGRLGTEASTAAIAREAGVAEGTLFRYFASKDLLLQAVFAHLLDRLATALAEGHGPHDPHPVRARQMWDNYIGWGVNHPAAHAALNQLAVSGRMPPALLEKAGRLGAEAGCEPPELHFEGLSRAHSMAFTDTLMAAVANTTVQFIAAHPDQAEACKAAGFIFVSRMLQEGPRP